MRLPDPFLLGKIIWPARQMRQKCRSPGRVLETDLAPHGCQDSSRGGSRVLDTQTRGIGSTPVYDYPDEDFLTDNSDADLGRTLGEFHVNDS